MNLLSLLLCSVLMYQPYQNTSRLYDLQFNTLDSSAVVSMSNFEGRQLIIIEFDASNPDRLRLQSLDTLYRNSNGLLSVIAVPAQDFGTPMPYESLKSFLRDTLELSYMISDVAYTQKAAGAAQHALFKWLTNVNENLHFDDDITDEGQMFVISEAGILYAVLHNNLRPNDPLMQSILNIQPPAN